MSSIRRIGQSVIAIAPECVTTTLHGGAVVHAEPHDTPEYAETAARLGYGADVARMNRDHELMHSLIAAWLGLPESPVMRAVADGTWQHDPGGLLALEEEACCIMQRLAMAWNVDLLTLTRTDP